ncbi:uncharacterized protein LOC134750519 [Cydia strobilella]|uniref:uncharacterized protein LOC134750519 n=1 Tax=Cydia strobilella TaxID=1100964 RepID=UPI003004F4C7
MSAFNAPIPLSDIEAVLTWVDNFKLSRPTKKINRDFSDAVLLAEILSVYYPKLVEMHNYPPRNSHALKLNNWMTLNRKVLRKLKLNLCCSTMEQLSNCAPGVIERVLIMVKEKIHRDEELNKSKEGEEPLDSGGSYYEACGDDEHVLVVPVKSRVNGILETIQQKVVSHDTFLALKQELKDLQECNDVLKNKVEHLDNLMKLKDERIDELQKQLERKQTRRKEVEALVNSLSIPFEPSPPSPKISDSVPLLSKSASLKFNESVSKIPVLEDNKSKEEAKLIKFEDKSKDEVKLIKSEDNISPIYSTTKPMVAKVESLSKIPKLEEFYLRDTSKTKIDDKRSEERILKVESMDSFRNGSNSKHSLIKRVSTLDIKVAEYEVDVDNVESNVFKEFEMHEQRSEEFMDEFKDTVEDVVITIEDSIKKEVKEITDTFFADENYI